MKHYAPELNFDVLERIFSHIEGKDLVSASAVSHSFWNGATAKIYRMVIFTTNNANRYPRVVSPFYALSARPALGAEVREISILAMPMTYGRADDRFISECSAGLRHCTQIVKFQLQRQATWDPSVTPDMVFRILKPLTGKPSLKELRIHGTLHMSHMDDIFTDLPGIRSVWVEDASHGMLVSLQYRSFPMSRTLTHLSINGASFIDGPGLAGILSSFPNLLGLCITGFLRINSLCIFRLLKYVPLIQHLALPGIMDNAQSFGNRAELFEGVQNLTHLTVYGSFGDDIIDSLWLSKAPITCLILDKTQKMTCIRPYAVRTNFPFEQFLRHYSRSITSIRVLGSIVPLETIHAIMLRCPNLGLFATDVSSLDRLRFINLFSSCASLHTLQICVVPPPNSVFLGTNITTRPPIALELSEIKTLLKVVPSLQKLTVNSIQYTKNSAERGGEELHAENLKHSLFESFCME